MSVSPASLENARIAYHANFLRGLDRAMPIWDQIATRYPSSTSIESYPFMHAFPKMQEWIGPRKFEELKASDYSLKNKKFQSSVKVPREDIEDDRIGLWNPVMEEMGESAAYWPDELVTDVVIAGGSEVCYDGQFFFDTDHPVDPFDASKGTQANLFTSKPLTEDNFAGVLASMRVIKDASGKVIRVFQRGGVGLMVPAALEKTARTIVEAPNISQNNGASATASTQTNVYRGAATVIVNPLLDADSETSWYLFDASKPVKPIIFQERVAAEFQQITNAGDEHVIKFDEYVFGARARGAAGYGLWQLAAKCEA